MKTQRIDEVMQSMSPNTDVSPLPDDGQGHLHNVTHGRCAEAVSQICAEIRFHHRKRVDLLRAEKRIEQQIKAIERRIKKAIERAKKEGRDTTDYEMVGPDEQMEAAKAVLHKQRLKPELEMKKLAMKLPVWESFCKNIRGFGALGLAQIVGEAGDLSKYDSPAKLWKRMGLAVIMGERQRCKKDAELALLHGYSPQRRSVMSCLADSMIRARSNYLYDVYVARKEYEHEQHPDMSDGHCHNRAKRYMEKRMLRDLWRAWRKYV